MPLKYPALKNSFRNLISFTLLVTLMFVSVKSNAQEKKEISKSVYITSNIGERKNSKSDEILKIIVEQSKKDNKAVFLSVGNNTSPNGYPKKDQKRAAEERLLTSSLLDPLKDFNGEVILVPGKNEWNSGGQNNLDDLESFLQDNSTAKFWPNDGCPLERETLSDEVELLMVDSQWYLEDWDKHPYMNSKCEIKTREQFFIEFADELKDEQNKTIIVAIHHPILSANRRGFFERLGGFSNQAYFSNEMQYLTGRLETIASRFEDVIFVSGNHRNLQFMMDDGIPQIMSGATAATQKTRDNSNKVKYASDENGFSKLNVFKDGSSEVEIYTVENGKANLIFTTPIKLKKASPNDFEYYKNDDFGPTYEASVYTKEETDKSGIYKWFWGEHYRDAYGKQITAPVLFLDSLPFNVRAITEGGGNQSRSLRLIDDNENEFTVRELRKSAVRFIQSSIDDHYVLEYARNTVAEDIVQDFYTTSHPYAQFAVNDLMDAVNLLHATPKVVYLPKQERLGRFNGSYGDKLYMIEEHVGDENIDLKIFGDPDDIISTSDLFIELRNDPNARVDEAEYLKARLFDMLIGDWDRHADQWRWAMKEQKDGTNLYTPIPRDRDQAFPKYDGVFPAILKLGAPLARNMQSYAPEIKNIKTFNNAGFYLDKSFINRADWSDWKNQAEFIQQNLTDDVIDNAFANLLPDTTDEDTDKIKEVLKLRRENLVDIAKNYFEYFKKYEIIVATTKDNTIDILREKDGVTNITVKQNDTILFKNTYSKDLTKEVWVYGLDGDDSINVTGDGNNYIKLKIFGGEENDIYDIQNRRNVKVYDYASKKNTFKTPVSTFLSDSYDINNYDPQKRIYSNNVILPSVGFDPDAGFKVGVSDTYTTYRLKRNPFTTQHKFAAKYYSATQGIELEYYGEFAHVFYNWNLGFDARYTTDNYATNFFGIGNETVYDDDAVDMDFNRTKIQQWHIEPSLQYKKYDDFTAHISARLESNEVDDENNGFAQQFFTPASGVFERQLYAGGEVGLNYNNKQGLISYPRRGMEAGLIAGYKRNIEDGFNNEFSYVQPTLSFIYPIHESGAAAIATKAQANFIIGDSYEFYHAATVGGNESLRGFRNERFLGQTSFYQSTDLRVGITQFRTAFVPIRIGVTAGFDYGRVWNDNDNSDKWHNSYGGSIFINGFKAITANVGYYVSDEDSRILFTAGFRF
ncbi:ShlB/FhaC/HecB family hemolysin secretion/activation protein [Nonlabens antarcticus]|uniref:ShlB/FhaC/HecB family hemolysin secretion/activation protein n=1 Tax=Nonlabens antarcticus TaxID=392714 RepID=UPI0018918C7F|nr:ShlB/FhaC/HecB family hemolysin secretion/activation protein [Nonlabens antarcticus]